MIGFASHTAVFGIGPETELPYALVSGMGADITRQMRAAGHAADSLDEPLPGVDRRVGEGEVLSAARVLADTHVQQVLRDAGCTTIVPFKTSTQLEARTAELGLRLLAKPARLVRQLENKLTLTTLADEAAVRAPQTRNVVVGPELVDLVDGPVIFQPAVGFAGDLTTLLDSPRAITSLQRSAHGKAGKLAEYIDGAPLTANGVVIDAATVMAARPARQLTGIPSGTGRPFGACGNEWSIASGDPVSDAMRDMTERIGRVLGSRGFRGIFGIDAVATSGGDLFLIEVNPRCTANMSLAIQLQQLAGQHSLFAAHLTAYDVPGAPTIDTLRDQAAKRFDDVDAASVIAFNTGESPLECGDDLPSGVYCIDGAELRFVGEGYRLEHVPDEHHVLVLTHAPARAVPLGHEAARLTFRRPVLADTSGRTLLPEIEHLVGHVRTRLAADAGSLAPGAS